MLVKKRLDREFFRHPTVEVAKKIIGHRLVHIDSRSRRLSGIIVETEAYVGTQDLACHARSGKTKRNATMWGQPGHAYVYLTYGIHWMLNLVTEREGFPAAILLRGMWPIEGIPLMIERRAGRQFHELVDGPAKICQALSIDGSWDGHDLCAPNSKLFIEFDQTIQSISVTRSPRVGLNTVPEPWRSMPWRFFINPDVIQKDV
jgi:DNA-3-methyladenine glycosylase